MQLFITPYTKQEHSIILTEDRVVHQLKNVLRSKAGTELKIQGIEWNQIVRYTLSITDMDSKKIVASIIAEERFDITDNKNFLCVALPNKFEKMEFIVQKCTEIGLQHIIFFSSQYSQLRDISDNKIERLSKIALEAVEQSYWLNVPQIVFTKDINQYLLQWQNILLHQDWIDSKKYFTNVSDSINSIKNYFIWPEWWRWSEDEKIFSQYDVERISLWRNILRTETASIVVAREAMK